MTVIHIKANLTWEAFRDSASGLWIAVCDPLKLTVQGETWKLLLESAQESMDMMFGELLATNELDRFLEEHGWKRLGDIPHRPSRMRFDVPFNIKQRKKHDTERALAE